MTIPPPVPDAMRPDPDWDAEHRLAEPPDLHLVDPQADEDRWQSLLADNQGDDRGDDHDDEPGDERREDAHPRLIPGGVFLRSVSDTPEPIWGDGAEVLASRGEPCLITGPIGAGKTSVTSGIVRGSLGLATSFLGYPITESRRVLYLACDRPKQIARNLRRSIDPDTPHLDERLIFWAGPPPRDIARNPELLLSICRSAELRDGDRLIVDGLKDIAAKISDEETGFGLNNAFQRVVREGIDTFANHHQRKAQGGKSAGKPKSLDDVYGSTWVTAGAGTVLLLWADKPGSSFVTIETLKPAGEHVGPLTIRHDLDTGLMTPVDNIAPEDVLKAAPGWHALPRICLEMGVDGEDRNGRERVRRRLHRLVSDGLVESRKVPNENGGKDTEHFLWVRR